MTDAWHRFIKNVELRRFVVLLLIVFALWMMRSMMNMILLTFILTFIVVSWVRFVQRWLPHFSTKLLVILTYLVLLMLLYFGITRYLPVLVHQVNETVHFSPAFRYLSRHHFPLLAEEEEREFSPRFKYIATHYMTSFALRQHRGYYVFALREILV